MAHIAEDTPFARTLRLLRERSGVTLNTVAAAVGTSRTHIWQLETARRRNPTLDLLQRLASYFEVSVGMLIGEVPLTLPQNDEAGRVVAQFQRFAALSNEERDHALALAHAA